MSEGGYTKKEIAKEVSSWIRDGLEIGRMETEKVRKLKYMEPAGFGCICKKQVLEEESSKVGEQTELI